MLFKELEPPVQGQFLDLGCGYGVIGLAIAKAVCAGQRDRRDVKRAGPCWPRQRAGRRTAPAFVACLPSRCRATRSSTSLANPPIRIGKEALHELLLTWLPRLAPGGRMVMVVARTSRRLAPAVATSAVADRAAGQQQGLRVLETRRD